MEKTTENIEPQNNSVQEKAYLKNLLSPIKTAYTNKENVAFKIVATTEKGFSVKVGGLFAFVSYYHFCWAYPSTKFWQHAAKHLVGSFFTGKIYKLTVAPISIQINASQQQFSNKHLKRYNAYTGVILQKTTYGVFVDVGVHFNWEFGSLLGLVHKDNLLNPADYNSYTVGYKITTEFQGFDENEQLVLGDNRERAKWWNGDLAKLINTTQNATVLINNKNQAEFYVLGKYKAIVFTKPKTNKKSPTQNYKNGEIIPCKILNISKRKYCFVIEPQ